MNSLPVITCAVCKRPVDLLEVMVFEPDSTLIFRVWCHGERDECRLDRSFLYDHHNSIVSAVAFQAKRVAA